MIFIFKLSGTEENIHQQRLGFKRPMILLPKLLVENHLDHYIRIKIDIALVQFLMYEENYTSMKNYPFFLALVVYSYSRKDYTKVLRIKIVKMAGQKKKV
jgi:hypothetical protein